MNFNLNCITFNTRKGARLSHDSLCVKTVLMKTFLLLSLSIHIIENMLVKDKEERQIEPFIYWIALAGKKFVLLYLKWLQIFINLFYHSQSMKLKPDLGLNKSSFGYIILALCSRKFM